MKKKILVVLSFCLLLTSIHFLSSNEVRRGDINYSEHHEMAKGLSLSELREEKVVNDVEINETVNKKKTVKKSTPTTQTTEESKTGKEVVEELEDDGYVLDEESSTETVKVLRNGSEIKVIAYNEPVPEKRATKTLQRVISASSPYKYSQDGVNFEYYVKDAELVFEEEVDGIWNYSSNLGFETRIEAGAQATFFTHVVSDSSVAIENMYKITSNHKFKLEENAGSSVLNIYSLDDELVTTFFVSTSLDYMLSQPDQEQNDVSKFSYDIDEETNMVNVKTEFSKPITEEIDEDAKYVVELATFNDVVGTKDSQIRGTRQNGPDYAYPYISGTSDLTMGGAGEPFKVRIGKNIESFTNEGFSSINAGYYEDKTNYNDVINNLGVKTRLVDADLKMYLVGPPSATGGYMTNKEYFDMSCYSYGTLCNVPEYAKSGTYIINAMYGGYNTRQISYNNVLGWDTAGSVRYEAAGVNRTTLSYTQATSTWIEFDISHAVGAWLRNNNTAQQLLQINNYGPDNYFATQALGNGSYAPYIELTLEEIPDFEANPYAMEDTNVNVRSFTRNDHRGSVTNVAIGIDGLTTMDALVKYEVYEVNGGKVITSGSTVNGAQNTYAFPMYLTEIENINNYYLVESNYQVEKLIPTKDLEINKVYGVRVMPYFEDDEGNLVTDKGTVIDESDDKFWYKGDTFQIYKVGYQYEVLDRILNFYGRDTKALQDESYFDNNMHNHLISENNKLFIRNPSKNAGKSYVATDLGDLEKYLIDQGLMGMGYQCEFGFEPINFNNGNFVYSSVDALIHSKGNPINFTRFYNAQEIAAPSSFGRNWSSTIDYRMQILDNGSIVFKDESGTAHVITKNSDESYNPSYTGYSYSEELARVEEKQVDSDYYAAPRGEDAVTSTIKVNHYYHIFTSSSGDKIYFNDELKLEKIVTNTGEVHKFVNGFYGVEKYILPDGKEIVFKYNTSAFVEQAIFDDGTSIDYKYDANDNLISAIDQSGVEVKYNYNSSYGKNLMTSYESGDTVYIRNEYDDQMRVVKQTDALGNVSKLEYKEGYTVLTDNNGNTFEVHYNELGHTTKVVDNGYTTEKIYNDKMQVIQENEIDEDGNKLSTFYEYNELNQVVKTTYPTGEVAEFEYDGFDLAKATTPSGVSEFIYDDNNRLVSTSKNGVSSTSNVYDAKGNLISETNEHGGVTKYTYYDDNNLRTVTTPLGYTTTYEYDELGFMKKKTNELGQTITYETSARGELLKTTYSDGSYEMYEYADSGEMLAKRDRDGVIFNYEYDSIGNLVKIITPYYELRREYDGNNNLIKEIDGNGNATEYEYDHEDRLIKTIYPTGLVEETVYDSDGNVVSRKDNVGVLETNEYDGFNRLVKSVNLGDVTKTTYSDTKMVASFTNDLLNQRYRYDEYGEVLATVSATGVESTQTKDELGILRTSSDGLNVISYSYDSAGNTKSTTDVMDYTTSKVYGPYNLVLSETDADGIKTEYTYDINGRMTSRKVGGRVVEQKEYTSAGRVKFKIDGEGNKTEYAYDDLGRVDYIIHPNGGINDYVYDSNNNIVEFIDANGNKTKYMYDSRNQRVAIIDAQENKTTTEYDLRGNTVREIRADSAVKTYEYNKNNKLVKEVDYNGVVTTYTYDDKNREVEVKKSTGETISTKYDKYGRSYQTTSFNKTQEVKYDKYNREVGQVLVDSRTVSTEFDKLGREIKSINEFGEAFTKQYSPAGKLLRTTYEDGTFELYEYDALGNQTKVTDRLGNTTTNTFDNNNNLIKSVDALGNTRVTEYNSLGKVSKEIDALGNETIHEYDLQGNEYLVEDALGNKLTRSYNSLNQVSSEVDALNYQVEITYTKLGQIERVIRKDNVVEEYSYDVSGNEVSKSIDGVVQYKKTFDLLGNVVTEIDANKNKTTYKYDEESRLIKTIAPNGNVTTNKYDKYGNLLETKDSLGVITKNTYDKHHRLVSSVDALGNKTVYTYEEKGENLLVQTDANKNKTTYKYDVLDRNVLTINEKGVETKTVYDAVGNVIQEEVNNATTYKTYDANNNVISEVDELGVEVEYRYDELNRNIATVDGNGHILYTKYDELGREVEQGVNETASRTVEYNAYAITSETDANGLRTEYQYDAFGNVVKSKQNDELITSYLYDNNSNLVKVIKNNTTIQEYKYDNMNNSIYFENTNSITHKYEYDKRSRMTAEIKNDGSRIEFEYDNADNIVKEVAGESAKEHTYNKYGNLEQTEFVENGNTYTTNIKYDKYNRMIEVVDPNENTIKYEYDSLDRRTALVYSDGSTQRYEYNEKGIVVSTTTRDDIVIDFTYDNNYNIINETYSNGVEASFEYDQNNNPTSTIYTKDSEVIESATYEYDEGGRVVENNREVDGKTIQKSYEYDNLNQLSKAEYNVKDGMVDSNIVYEYEYDKLSNRTIERVTTDGVEEVFVEKSNKVGQIISREGSEEKITYEYDKNGNLIEEKQKDVTIEYDYNDFGKLSATSKDGLLYEDYQYDGFGNRIGKTSYSYYDEYASARKDSVLGLEGALTKAKDEGLDCSKGSTLNSLESELTGERVCDLNTTSGLGVDKLKVEYVNDISYENALVLEVKEDTEVYNTFIYENPIMSTINEEVEVNVLTRSNTINARIGEEVYVHEYATNGQELEVINDFEIVNELGYNGEIEDNLNMQYLRARYYKQDSARFISEDTYRGDTGRGQSHNSYIYTENNPVEYVDRSGESVVYKGPSFVIKKFGTYYHVYITTSNILLRIQAKNRADNYLRSKRVARHLIRYHYVKSQKEAYAEPSKPTNSQQDAYTNGDIRYEPQKYNESYGLKYGDRQFVEKAIMCDKLEDSGLTTDEIKYAINEYSLEELENFLKWRAETGGSFSDWQEEKDSQQLISNPTLRKALEWISTVSGVLGVIPGPVGIVFDLISIFADAALQDWIGVIIGVICLVLPIVGKNIMDFISAFASGGLKNGVKAVSKNIDSGLSIAKKGLDGAYSSLKNWSPKLKFTKSAKSNLLQVVGSFKKAIVGVGNSIKRHFISSTKEIIHKAFGARSSELTSICSKVVKGMAEESMHAGLTDWNKFQKLFSEFGGYKHITKYDGWFVEPMVKNLYASFKFTKSKVGLVVVYVASVEVGNVVEDMVTKAVNYFFDK